MVSTQQHTDERARAAVAEVLDPELPLLTIDDLGILRDVVVDEAGRVRVALTPTYSACPAFETIQADVVQALHEAGYDDVTVSTVLSPAWTTDWISAEGRQKLVDSGTAPPAPRSARGTVSLTLSVRCPRCGSPDTRELSRFGATACKSLWACNSCREPFDHVKAL